QAEDGIRDKLVTGVQTCALPIYPATHSVGWRKLPAALLGTRTTHIHVLSLTDRMVEHTPLKGFPIWPILTVTAILPATRIVKRFRSRKRGFCPQCSYNLTGNTSGICPECGTRISGALMTANRQ